MEEILRKLIEKFNVGNKDNVYVSVTASVGLEMIQVDPSLKVIKNYAYRPLEYNEGMREIANYDDFRTKLGELFNELGINAQNCNVVLGLPTVHFGKIVLPALLSDESIDEAVISETERSYIFRRCEPVVSWFEAQTHETSEFKTIIYSAVQKPVVITIKSILSDFGATLVGMEPSIMTVLEALSFTNLAETNMGFEGAWSLLLVNSNGYSILALEGKNIVDYYDEPLALKTYGIDEIYGIINSSLRTSLVNFTKENLYIISETDLVSAEHLASIVEGAGKVLYLENNAFKKNEFLQATLDVLQESVLKISLEAIGIAVSKVKDVYPVKIDFSGSKVSIKTGEESYTFVFADGEFVLTETLFKKWLIILALVLFVPAGAIFSVCPLIKNNKQVSLDNAKRELSVLDAKVNKLAGYTAKSNTFVLKNEIERVVKANRTKLIAYSALGESIPSDLWITTFIAQNDGKIDIKGLSDNVKDIYLFFSNMKYSLVDSQIRLHKLEMQADTIDEAISSNNTVYSFEITNMSEAELNPVAEDIEGDDSEKNVGKSGNKKSKNDAQKNEDKQSSAKPVNQLEPVDIGK